MSQQPDDRTWEEEHINHLNLDIQVLQDQLKYAYCGIIGSDSIVGLGSCDDYKEWLSTLGANPINEGNFSGCDQSAGDCY